MITPTNGRIVWIMHLSYEQPLAAIITKVHSFDLINVCAFGPDGVPAPLPKVRLVHDRADSDINVAIPYAVWMPYQKGQAAKTEELEKRRPSVQELEAILRSEEKLAVIVQPDGSIRAEPMDRGT
jgi:hypothetical protein